MAVFTRSSEIAARSTIPLHFQIKLHPLPLSQFYATRNQFCLAHLSRNDLVQNLIELQYENIREIAPSFAKGEGVGPQRQKFRA